LISCYIPICPESLSRLEEGLRSLFGYWLIKQGEKGFDEFHEDEEIRQWYEVWVIARFLARERLLNPKFVFGLDNI